MSNEEELIKDIIERIEAVATNSSRGGSGVPSVAPALSPAVAAAPDAAVLVTDTSKAPASKKRKVVNKIKNLPSEEITGVSETLTRICAAVSGQIYQVKGDVSKFDLNLVEGTEVEVLELVTQGDYADTVPPFVIAKAGSTMIVGWRGSTTIMDWTADFNASPVVSKASGGLRIQASFMSLIESDFVQYGEKIIALIKDNNISEVIFTGHSLGGALAQVAHALVVAQLLSHEQTIWDSVEESTTFRSLAFSAPMSIAIEPDNTKHVEDILEKIRPNMCNIIYSYDPVPRAYSMIDYLLKVVNAVVESSGRLTRWGLKNFVLPDIVVALLEEGTSVVLSEEEEGSFKRLLKVLFRYQHVGVLVYYENAEAVPQRIVDSGPVHSDGKSSNKELTLESVDFTFKTVSAEGVGDTHNFLVRGPGLAC